MAVPFRTWFPNPPLAPRRASRGPGQGVRHNTCTPRLEALEDRLVLSSSLMEEPGLTPLSHRHLATEAVAGIAPGTSGLPGSKADSDDHAGNVSPERDPAGFVPPTLGPTVGDSGSSSPQAGGSSAAGPSDFQSRLDGFTAPGAPPAPNQGTGLQPEFKEAAPAPEASVLRLAAPVKVEDVQDQPNFQHRLDSFTSPDKPADPSARPMPVPESNLALVATLLTGRAEGGSASAEPGQREAPPELPAGQAGDGLQAHPDLGAEEALSQRLLAGQAALPAVPPAPTAGLVGRDLLIPQAREGLRTASDRPESLRGWNPGEGQAASDGAEEFTTLPPATQGGPHLSGAAENTPPVSRGPARADTSPGPGQANETAPPFRPAPFRDRVPPSPEAVSAWFSSAALLASRDTLTLGDDNLPTADAFLPTRAAVPEETTPEARQGKGSQAGGYAPVLLVAAVFAAGLCRPWLQGALAGGGPASDTTPTPRRRVEGLS